MNSHHLGVLLGVALIIIGAMLPLASHLRTTKNVNSSGNVSIGRDNSGQITNVNVRSDDTSKPTPDWTKYLSLSLRVIGILVAIWNGIQLIPK